MWLTRLFILVGATALVGFFLWPLLSTMEIGGEISFHAGSYSAQIPAVIGLFGTMGLAAMLWMVQR